MAQEALLAVRRCTANMDVDRIAGFVENALQTGNSAYAIMMDGMAAGMEEVGRKYEACEYFLSDLIMAGETVREGMRVLRPRLKVEKVKAKGTVVIGSARGDLHDIGKNLVAMMLESVGFEVFDLGVDVAPMKFVDEARARKAQIVAMSALLTTTMGEMAEVVKAFRLAGMRDRVGIIIGGAPVTKEFAERIGSDGNGSDAIEAIKICKQLMTRFGGG